MQRVIFLKLIFLFCLFSCKKDDFNNPTPENNKQLKALKAPGIIRNDLAKGKLALPLREIVSVSGNESQSFVFSYVPGTDRLQKIEYRLSDCNYVTENFYYRPDSLIDYIETEEAFSFYNSMCPATIKRFNYNYKDGYLQNIICKREGYINEKYFSYNSKGQVEKLLYSFRNATENFYGYSEVQFELDDIGNVVKTIGYTAGSKEVGYGSSTLNNYINPLKGYHTVVLRSMGGVYEPYNVNNPTVFERYTTIYPNIQREKYVYTYDSMNRVVKRLFDPPDYKLEYYYFYR